MQVMHIDQLELTRPINKIFRSLPDLEDGNFVPVAIGISGYPSQVLAPRLRHQHPQAGTPPRR